MRSHTAEPDNDLDTFVNAANLSLTAETHLFIYLIFIIIIIIIILFYLFIYIYFFFFFFFGGGGGGWWSTGCYYKVRIIDFDLMNDVWEARPSAL